jgi:hypothetical protein
MTIEELENANAELIERINNAPEDSDYRILENSIAELIERKNNATEGSPEYELAMRCLASLRYSREDAGPIMEDLDPYEWGATTPLPHVDQPEGRLVSLRQPAGMNRDHAPFSRPAESSKRASSTGPPHRFGARFKVCCTGQRPLLGEQRKTFAQFEFFRFDPDRTFLCRLIGAELTHRLARQAREAGALSR